MWFQTGVYSVLHPLAHVWVAGVEWLLLPAMCLLLGDRVRREARRGRSIGICFVAWIGSRVVLASVLGISGGVYDGWVIWVVPTTPAALWMFFLWKQERSTSLPEAEKAHA